MEETIDSADDLNPADKVELRVMDLATGEVNRYHSLVQDVTSTGINVSMPSDGKTVVPLREGTPLVVALWKDHADHRFPTRVVKRTGGKVPMLILAKPTPDQITRSPRREYFRVETKLPATIFQTSEGKLTRHDAVILDLSVSGCRLRTNAQIPIEHPITIDVELPFPPDKAGNDQTKPIKGITGTVKARFGSEKARPDADAYLGIQFSVLTNVVQTALLRYVALRQRELIQQITDPEGVARRAEQAAERAKKQAKKAEVSAKPETAPAAASAEPAVEVAREEARAGLEETERQIEESFGGKIPEDPTEDVPVEADAAEDVQVEAPRTPSPPEAETPSPPAPKVEPPPPAAGPTSAPARKRILVVDDEEGIREVLAMFLEGEGYEVLQAENGREGLEMALRTPFDLVLTDLMMPEMNGWRLVASLREQGNDVPVVVITGYMIREGQDVLTSRDVAGYLVKPLKLPDLKKVTDRILRAPEVPHPKVLAVDDEEDVRTLVRAQLEPEGFEVETASDGAEALSKVVSFQPDLVLMDIVMPRVDGFKATEHIRQLSDVPVLMLTSKTSQEYVKRAVSLNVAGYIVKPYETTNLVSRIRQVLRAKSETK